MTTRFDLLIPQYIQTLPVYVPGKPIEEVERELKIHAVKLASNENAFGPSPKALEAMRRVASDSHRYPDGGTVVLREKLAELRGVRPEQVFIGLGSSEIIDLASRVLLREGLQGITSEGSYAPFSIAIRMNRGELRRVPLRNYGYDLEALAEAITPATRIIYIANPNNPTGTAFGAAEFARFLGRVREDICVVLDEAYFHYAARPDMPHSNELFRAHPNLLVLRTFSKVYGLAGVRIGYGVGDATLVEAMNKLRTPFNVSGLAQAAALAALEDKDHVSRCVEENARERAKLVAALQEMGLKAIPSETNFVFVDLGVEAAGQCEELLHRGVIIRPLAWMGLPKGIRISVGTHEENEKCLKEMRAVFRKIESKA
jgi:histidinol-phosphate aminotransferase